MTIKVKNINPIWDYIDDYYYCNVNNHEVNIRVFKDDIIGVWIFDHTNDKEVLDGEFEVIERVKLIMYTIFKVNIKLPNIEQLRKIREE